MGLFNAFYARQAMTRCLRPGEALTAFVEASDDNDLPKTGVWADAGTTWLGITKARILEVHSANGEVISTPWSEVASVETKSGFLGGQVSIANTTWPNDASAYKVNKSFAKQMGQSWAGTKEVLPVETITVSIATHPRLGGDYWFCDACGQPCGNPQYQEAPRERCDGCCRNVVGGQP